LAVSSEYLVNNPNYCRIWKIFINFSQLWWFLVNIYELISLWRSLLNIFELISKGVEVSRKYFEIFSTIAGNNIHFGSLKIK